MSRIAQLFLKINWADPMTWLSIFGALGAPDVIWRIVRFLGGVTYPLWLRVSERTLVRDFFYVYREVGYRVPQDGKNYLYIRKEKITSIVKELGEVPFRYRWTCEGDFFEEITPADYSLRDAPREMGHLGRRRVIVLQPPLPKRKSTEYEVKVKCVQANTAPEPFLGIDSPRRVDELVLRVMFPPDRMPTQVRYRMLDADGRQLHQQSLDRGDPLTCEYKITLRHPKPLMTHQLVWE